MKIHRDHGPSVSPNAAPLLKTSVSRNQSPRTGCGVYAGVSRSTAKNFVNWSSTTIPATEPRNRAGVSSRSSLLPIFLPLLALDAESRMRQRVEAIEADLAAAVVALPELL